MSDQKSFLLRLPKPLMEAYQKWAADELRSLNGQIEYVLRNKLKEEGRLPKDKGDEHNGVLLKKRKVEK